MKKLLCLLLVIFLLTGCNITKFDQSSYDSIINQVLNSEKENKLSNQTFEGYKLYLPQTVSLYDKNDTNLILKYKNSRMYLYIDTVSYYHKTENLFEAKNDNYYSKDIKYKDNFGYIEINKIDNKYFVEIMYNYAKIEAYVSEEDLNDTVYNSIIILSSITYNDKVLESLVGTSSFNYKEEVYNIFQPIDSTDNYLNFEEDIYEDYDGEIKDEDSIIIEDNTKE